MNDRLKYRIFYDNKIVYPNSWNNIESIYECLKQQTMWDCKIDTDIKFDHIANNLIFMQCTGKKDTNRKLIYEDDIVELKAKNGMTFQYVVKFKDYCFILEYINGKLKGKKARNFAKQYAQLQRMYEHGYMVIGNIYENKDLLERESK